MKNHSELVKNHFELKYTEYDSLIARLIPKYKEMHQLVVDSVSINENQEHRVLDLGIGTGQTAIALLEKFSKLKLHGVDISPNMINQAKKRVNNYLEKICFEEIDMKKIEINNNTYDSCVAVLSIHHLNGIEKKSLFKKVYKSLKNNGSFVIGDLIRFDSDKETKEKEQEWIEFLELNFSKTEANYWFKNYQEEDIPSSVNFQLQTLKEAGFSSVKCIWTHINYAVIVANK